MSGVKAFESWQGVIRLKSPGGSNFGPGPTELCSRAADWAAQAPPRVHVSVVSVAAVAEETAGRKMESHIHIARKRLKGAR